MRYELILLAVCFNFILIFLSCENNTALDSANLKGDFIEEHIIVTADNHKIEDATSVLEEIAEIKINANTVVELGVVFDFQVINDGIILVDRNQGRISKLSTAGSIMWQIDPNVNDRFVHNEILNPTSFDVEGQRLIVYDDNDLFSYSFKGDTLGTITTYPLHFLDHEFIDENNILFATNGTRNTFDEGFKDDQLIWVKSKKIRQSFINKRPKLGTEIGVGGRKMLTEWKGQYAYHSPLMDTVYAIKLPEVKADFILRFASQESSQEIMYNPKIEKKLSYLVNKELANFYTIASTKERIVATYTNPAPATCLLVIDREKKRPLINTHYLRWEDKVIEAPILYSDGYLLTLQSDYKTKHLAKISSNNMITGSWKEELKILEENSSDNEGATLYLMKLR